LNNLVELNEILNRRFLELKQYILERRDGLVKAAPEAVASGKEKAKAKGFGRK
jgi:hypothetical protein